MDVLFARPAGDPVLLSERPAPDSWDHATHPQQQQQQQQQQQEQRLAAFLTSLTEDIGWSAHPEHFATEHLAVRLDVALPPGHDLTRGGHDLDTYLYPVVRRLGPKRFDAAFASKAHGTRSSIRIEPARPAPASPGPAPLDLVTTTSATSIDWKEQVYRACLVAAPEPAPPGPVDLHVRLTVSRQRNWAALWKPAIDALGPVLGVPDPARPFRADDDRITSLALHRRFDDSVGHRVRVQAWWHPA